MSEVAIVFLAGVATMFATGLGALPVHYFRRTAYNMRPALIGVAIGAMAVASVVGLLGPGLDLGSPAEVWGGFALGAAMFFAVRSFLRDHQPRLSEVGGRDIKKAVLIFAVLFAHSLPEGFAVGTAFAAPDRDIGLFVILAIALQNVPEGTSVAIPMEDAGVGVMRQFWTAVATSAPQPVGAVIAYVLVEEISGILPVSFGFAAGAMLLLVALELIPDGFARGMRGRAALGVVFGALLIFLLEGAVVG
jgi:ZIP family zinc transporter